MSLEKAVITNLDKSEDIKVMFNPKEYVLEKKTPWSEVNVFGLDSPPVQFTMGERKRLSMELFFDTSEERPTSANTRKSGRAHARERAGTPPAAAAVCMGLAEL